MSISNSYSMACCNQQTDVKWNVTSLTNSQPTCQCSACCVQTYKETNKYKQEKKRIQNITFYSIYVAHTQLSSALCTYMSTTIHNTAYMSQHKMMNSNLTESRKKGFMVAKFSQLPMVSSTVGVYAGC